MPVQYSNAWSLLYCTGTLLQNVSKLLYVQYTCLFGKMDIKGMNQDASVTRREEQQEMELFREQRILHSTPKSI